MFVGPPARLAPRPEQGLERGGGQQRRRRRQQQQQRKKKKKKKKNLKKETKKSPRQPSSCLTTNRSGVRRCSRTWIRLSSSPLIGVVVHDFAPRIEGTVPVRAYPFMHSSASASESPSHARMRVHSLVSHSACTGNTTSHAGIHAYVHVRTIGASRSSMACARKQARKQHQPTHVRACVCVCMRACVCVCMRACVSPTGGGWLRGQTPTKYDICPFLPSFLHHRIVEAHVVLVRALPRSVRCRSTTMVMQHASELHVCANVRTYVPPEKTRSARGSSLAASCLR